jgi:hypothetical protein
VTRHVRGNNFRRCNGATFDVEAGLVRVHAGNQTEVVGAEMPLHHPDSTPCPGHGE